MEMQRVFLNSRAFYAQFCAVMAEFGETIPWLGGLHDLLHVTHCGNFARLFTRRMRPRCGKVTFYGYVDNAGEVFGGLFYFTKSPERFYDSRNVAIAEQLTTDGAGYASCLWIREEYRSQGVGVDMTRRALAHILLTHGAVWGVAPNTRLRDWWVALGAKSCSPEENTDNLWIVHWPTP